MILRHVQEASISTGDDLRRIAIALDGTMEAPHFDRRAFKVARTYVTLAADTKTANVKLTPEDQAFKCAAAPEVYAAIPNGWGRQGWTIITLAAIDTAELALVLRTAWTAAQKIPRKRKPRSS